MRICFFFNDTATTEIYTLSLHDALPIYVRRQRDVLDQHPQHLLRQRLLLARRYALALRARDRLAHRRARSEEHTSELQSRQYLVCRLLLEKKNKTHIPAPPHLSSAILPC